MKGTLSLDWYDYGARFYDPQIGRFHSIDPLMEWHFNYTPYHYTFNNPINYLDPFGLDTVKTDSNQPIKKGDVVVGSDGSSSTAAMDEQNPGEATVTDKGYSFLGRLFRKIGRAFNGGNSTYEKGGGIMFTTQFSAGGNENSTARNPDAESVNIDLIMALKLNAGPKSFGFDPLGPAKSIGSASKAIKETQGTSDREIVEGTTGTTERTDAHGNSIDNTINNYGKTEADSIVEPLLVIDYEDSTSVRDWKINKGSRAGRPISKPYTIKKNK